MLTRGLGKKKGVLHYIYPLPAFLHVVSTVELPSVDLASP